MLEAAAEEFLQPLPARGPFPSPSYLLALRQGGLRDDLFEIAAQRGVPGWFDPPLCLFAELPRWLGATEHRPLNDVERIALLGHLLRVHGGVTFAGREGDFVSSLDQFFGELRAEAVSPEAYAAAVAALPPREQFEEQRDADLVRVYASYVALLDRLGQRDGRDTLADTAAAMRASPQRVTQLLGGRREVRVFGLADWRGGWRLLLAALDESPAVDRVAIYATDLLPLPDGMLSHVERLGPKPRPGVITCFVPEGAVRLVAETDTDREIEAVASAVRSLVDAGTAPHRVAVVPRQARPYTDLLLRALEAAGVPATARRRVAWRHVPSVRAVLALFHAAAEGWTRHGLAELGAQPYFRAEVDPRVINFLGYRERMVGLEAWAAALQRLLAEAQAAGSAPEDESERRSPTLPAEWVAEAVQRFNRFRALAAEFEVTRPLADWLEWLCQWLARDPWEIERRIRQVPEDRWDVVRLDLLGWHGLRELIAAWRNAERAWPSDPQPLAVASFVERLRAMVDGDAIMWTGPGRGVQVVEALAASHRAFDHVFLVGMNAGHFPRRAPASLLLGERDREALRAAGLPLDTSAEWDARERALFRTLVAGARRTLTLSYTTLDDTGAEVIPSSFVDLLRSGASLARLEPPALPFAHMPALASHAHRTATIERLRATGALTAWNGLIEDPTLRAWLAQEFGDARVWSPTGIEQYAKCPWAWFSGRLLRLDRRDDPASDLDLRARGSLLHDALRRFYHAAAARAGGGTVFLVPADLEWAAPLLRECLDQALATAAGAFWLGHPTLLEIKRRELEAMLLRFLEFELEENEKSRDGRTVAGKMVRTAVEQHEVAFEAVAFERDGVRFLFRGILDRVEVGTDPRAPGAWVAAVDYKTTIWSCPGAGKREAWEDGVVLQVPLYAWALGQLRPGARVARVEYRAIKHAKRVHVLSPVRVSSAGVTDLVEDQARMDRALRAVTEHVRRLRAGEFPAAPAPSCNCPPFCHGWDICRVKGGPRTGRS